MTPHGYVEPHLSDHQSCIRFTCPCGWHSMALRPEAKGTLRIICTEYREHQDSVHPRRRVADAGAGGVVTGVVPPVHVPDLPG